MKVRKSVSMFVLGLVLAGTVLLGQGCKKSDEAGSKGGETVDSIQLCVKCGQIKGAELCCKPDQVKCSGCGLAKGSPGCCKIAKDAQTAAICAKCGQIKGSELCCKPDQAKCQKCGLVKGSPGCCKIPKK